MSYDVLAATKAQHQVESRLLLDVVIAQSAAVLELLASKDEALLVGRDALAVLNLLLDILNRVGRLHIQRDGLACERFYKQLEPHFILKYEILYTNKDLIIASGLEFVRVG